MQGNIVIFTDFGNPNFHKNYLKNRSKVIACQKLDSYIDSYLEKLTNIIDNSKINTLIVMTMKVPCCCGLLVLAKKASVNAKRIIPIKSIVVGIRGGKIKEEWI